MCAQALGMNNVYAQALGMNNVSTAQRTSVCLTGGELLNSPLDATLLRNSFMLMMGIASDIYSMRCGEGRDDDIRRYI